MPCNRSERLRIHRSKLDSLVDASKVQGFHAEGIVAEDF
ncbi:hypothetical protein SLEP1_g59744 [Rubroshorea leprosula]|uniref:Uncharacterized protein n=1 Tax=Rubroshorea leprosula TaxID=152421 RepID=A0AAV5MXT6_9ROSI|nr:hypothetical protein SLEP1_g59744 [Rubroshorea leprosula]